MYTDVDVAEKAIEKGAEEILRGTESLLLSLPTVYWVSILSAIAIILISVIIIICYISYRKKRTYAM